MDISIVIPVFNENKNLPILYDQLSAVFEKIHKDKDYEIIYIDDGSTDNSFEILKRIKLKDNRVRIISFDKNYGQTSAFDAGFRKSEGKFVISIDADLQTDCNDIIRILEELKSNDVVMGFRYNRREADGLIKFVSSRIANYVRNKILHEDIKDAGCFLRGYKRECLDKLILYRGFQVFTPSLLNMAGFKIKQIDVKCFPRRYGKSSYNISNRIIKELLALFTVRYMKTNTLRYKIKHIC